ncbi:hypothetical protein D0T84_03765 [Dysgonomonas sp. 521]|uniref:hypothetical protein n=1 Tax=Dysgonomonas sp. 521 TaxID=2302932 RepID=UPI0013D87F52|nr:hypothetical protein [Dysgonomonas sp. 521]NDV94035.1 hypothetical protein [Dysgonomonas sp. 521]
MKFSFLYLLLIATSLFMAQSCVDKDYDWDNLDKDGVISIPPVPLGNIDTIYIKGLPQGDNPWNIPIPDGSIVKSDTIKGLFDGDAVKNFFFEGAGNVEISSKIDLDLEIKGVTIEIYLNIIDSDGKRNTDVVIPNQSLTTTKNQQFSIKIGSEYMSYMQNARDLLLTIAIRADNATIWLGEDDYIYLREAIIKTGGFHYEL